ncbi:hypothetical protein HDU84_000026 [Entophlyctis sp. JEL0112]|nr:hypothetical protein HDU84_000026 [Entophlyctis sp. JEL0112]
MASASEIVERQFTVDDSNDDLWGAIDAIRKEKDRLAQQMGMDMQKKMHANNPVQLKLIANQVQNIEDQQRRIHSKYDAKILELNRILDEKKVRDQENLEKELETVQIDVANLKVETSFLAGQVDLLKKEAKERKKAFDDQIAEIRSTAADQKSWNEEIYAKVYTLQANSQLLMAEYEEKQKDLREKEYIDSDPNTSAVYNTVFSKMNEVFVASKAINSGMVSRAAYTKGDTAAKYLSLAGSLVPFPAATIVLGYISQGVQYLSDKREEERINNISGNALGFSEMDEICDWIARGIVFTYEEQIRALTTESATTFAECCVKYVLDFLASRDGDSSSSTSTSSSAANSAITPPRTPAGDASRSTSAIGDGDDAFGFNNSPTVGGPAPPAVVPKTNPRDALVSELVVYMSKRTGVKTNKAGIGSVKLETRIPGVTFSDRGIIKQTGLRTASGAYYHAAPPPPKPPAKQYGGVPPVIQHPRGRTATPPTITKTKSFSKLFARKIENQKEFQKEATIASSVVDVSKLQETLTNSVLNVALAAQEDIGRWISNEEDCRPDIYGYRLGTSSEAFILNMVEVHQKTPNKIVPLTPEQIARDPNAHSKFWMGK